MDTDVGTGSLLLQVNHRPRVPGYTAVLPDIYFVSLP